MDPSLLLTTGPTIHSPSEASYSSGPSRASTRSTSPGMSSHQSSLLDLHHPVTTSSIVPETSNDPVDQQPSKMDKNSAPPADGLNMRRPSSKFNMERASGPANYQQPQGVRPGVPMGPANLASRCLASNNWRAQAMADDMYNNFDLANPQNQQQQLHFGRPVPVHQQQPPTGISSLYPPSDSMVFPDALLDSCYAYCYDRGNGHYTRLIPADMIPSLCDVPALQQDFSGMIVLPAPRALPANGRSSNVEPIMLKTPPPTPTSPADNIQAHIDTIVGVGPRTPTHSHGGNNNTTSIASSTSSGGHTAAAPAPNMDQQQPLPLRNLTNNQGSRQPMAPCTPPLISTTTLAMVTIISLSSSSSSPQRRPKIYCDKWVHEGVCAFTQQGCKYKHEMPFDKMTQHQLGLFHGLPAWWKKHQAELARQRDPSDGEQDGPGPGPAPASGSAGEKVAAGPEGTRGGGGNFGGRGAGGGGGGASAMGSGHAGNNGPGPGGNLTWRRPNFGSVDDAAQGFGDHPMGSTSSRGSMGNNLGGHGLNTSQHHQRGNPMAPHSPLAWSKSPFGPIAPPTPAPMGHAMNQQVRVISTSNPYASLGNIDESLNEENKGD
ncbi:hypothetical protein PG993_005174 [Apiospora rasikravindrae]|uniref:C3H1-type domain-containing protein n=1 Tax=Apiospora rasikravindrae TaxID=990691 RepID=A0ABR1TEU7_9PEZI